MTVKQKKFFIPQEYEKAGRKFDKKFRELENARRCVEAGKLDHTAKGDFEIRGKDLVFADEENRKNLLRAIEAQQDELLFALFRQFPGLFKQYPDGGWGLADNNIIPLRRGHVTRPRRRAR